MGRGKMQGCEEVGEANGTLHSKSAG